MLPASVYTNIFHLNQCSYKHLTQCLYKHLTQCLYKYIPSHPLFIQVYSLSPSVYTSMFPLTQCLYKYIPSHPVFIQVCSLSPSVYISMFPPMSQCLHKYIPSHPVCINMFSPISQCLYKYVPFHPVCSLTHPNVYTSMAADWKKGTQKEQKRPKTVNRAEIPNHLQEWECPLPPHVSSCVFLHQ